MLLLLPTYNIDNSVTQLKHELVQDDTLTSTCLVTKFDEKIKDEKLIHWENINSVCTKVSIEKIYEKKISTWEETDTDEFDLPTALKLTKGITLKSKIRSVSKYTPNIIIE